MVQQIYEGQYMMKKWVDVLSKSPSLTLVLEIKDDHSLTVREIATKAVTGIETMIL